MNETAFLLFDEQDHLLDSAPDLATAKARAEEYDFTVTVVDSETLEVVGRWIS